MKIWRRRRRFLPPADKVCPQHAILASNTSCLSILDMAMATKRPSQVCGMHFFNPVPVLKPLEIIRTLVSSEETIKKAIAFGKSVGKQVITCKDTPGFIVNRIGVPLLLHSIRMYEQGLATKEDIDQGVMGGLNHPMGPLTLWTSWGWTRSIISPVLCLMNSKTPFTLLHPF